ncbi:DUF6786 family protein [Dyadobacter sandarakinus]|uniref:Lipoprotein n=1 Tax=Dyadobacter sandarakinus TaxID=2747268 RepID=A0ABX7I7U0_9BACT|nr:DUF6786 family protein [Dyadobacter sandarakinus]QRR02161.1 hypothetical protein HWI92_15235 [Dyadobacter sandarakinus]
MKSYPLILVLLSVFLASGCRKKSFSTETTTVELHPGSFPKGTFGYDLAFLKKHITPIILTAPDNASAKLIVIPEYQGRVMTSTAAGDGGNSYGWINYDLISSGRKNPHINAYGGEDRLWLSPEGGQFSVYFSKGDSFTYHNWQTPALIDSEPFEVVSTDSVSASFRKKGSLENYSGTKMKFLIERKVTMLTRREIQELLSIRSLEDVKATGYASENTLTNTGPEWEREKGAIGLWILGMFTPGEKTTIVAPLSSHYQGKPQLTADYFGKIPDDRLVVHDTAVFLKADGRYRSKIGLAPLSAKPVAGSYDAEKNILTVVQYDLNMQGEYLKSAWKLHEEPFKGDAFNAYNDGPLPDGTQMGPFYELESSSSVRILGHNDKLSHTHRTFHFEGDKTILNRIAEKLFGMDIDQIGEIFK